jgi:hypothetical protein
MRNVTAAPGWAFVRAATSAGERTASPSIATMRSPARRSGARRRLVGQRLVDQGRAEVAPKSERGHEVALPVGAVHGRQRHRAGQARAIRTLDADGDVGGTRRAQQAPAQVLPAAHAYAIHRDHEIAVADAGLRRGRVCRRRGEERPLSGNACDERAGEQQHGEQEVRDRARGDDRNALADALAVERPRQVRRGNGAFALVGHLDVAAERNRGEGPFGAVRPEPARPDDASETDGKAQHLDAAPACDDVVAEFVEDDQHAQHDEERGNLGHGVHQAASGSFSHHRAAARASASAARASPSSRTGRAGTRNSASAQAGAMSV